MLRFTNMLIVCSRFLEKTKSVSKHKSGTNAKHLGRVKISALETCTARLASHAACLGSMATADKAGKGAKRPKGEPAEEAAPAKEQVKPRRPLFSDVEQLVSCWRPLIGGYKQPCARHVQSKSEQNQIKIKQSCARLVQAVVRSGSKPDQNQHQNQNHNLPMCQLRLDYSMDMESTPDEEKWRG